MRPDVIRLLPYQTEAVAIDARFTWNCWARQTGKSFTFSLRRLVRGLQRRRNQIILSAGERQSREVMEKVRMHCQALKIWSELAARPGMGSAAKGAMALRISGGVRIIGLPANPMTARGFTGDVFLDEFAMHADDEAIWSALFPTILRGDGELDVASTPRGRQNLFYRLQSNPQFCCRTMTLPEAVRAGLEVDLQALRAAIDDDVAWRQEFECQFVDESTSFMPYVLIRGCQDAALQCGVDWERLERRQAAIYMGVDIGRLRDLTCIWLWERVGDALITRGVVILEAAPFAEQEALLCRLLDSPGLRRGCIDATGLGLHLSERLAERYGDHRIEPVVFTAAVKGALAGRLRIDAERGRLRIPCDESITADWHSVTRQVTAAGNVRYAADRGASGHADRFWAAALGLHAVGDDAAADAPAVVTGQPLTFARSGTW